MALVFDIETVGESWEALDDTTQENLSWYLRESARDDAEYAYQLKELQEGLGLSPLTGSIVAIGVYDTERGKGVVYYRADEDTHAVETVDGDITYTPLSEREMLERFWDGAQHYSVFVTFNGRSFDAPFLLIRSLVHRIRPTQDLLSNRYLPLQRGVRHVDLYDQLSFYGAARFKRTLHLFCRALGIESPKAGGVAGEDVAALFARGAYEDIARYNAGDLFATAALYERWKETLA